HYYWPLLVEGDPEILGAFRQRFGDETVSYADQLDRPHDQGPPPNWQETHVSAYATMHPWEDWAETFAHYLHLRDALQTASAFGIRIGGPDAPVRASPDAPLSALPDD